KSNKYQHTNSKITNKFRIWSLELVIYLELVIWHLEFLIHIEFIIKYMKVLFSGGGTMGSVSPLVAIYEELKVRETNLEVLWLGTKKGPEKEFLAGYQIPFKSIVSGKLRRYLSLWNILTPIEVIIGILQSYSIMSKFKPDIVLTAGSFVAVPVVYAAWLKKIPRIVHQQDLEIGLANKMMAKKATAVTVTFDESKDIFDPKKTFHIGNPIRKAVLAGNRDKGLLEFKLNSTLPTILILGGGTGALMINQMIFDTLGQLIAKYQVIHLTGKGKSISQQFNDYFNRETLKLIEERYRGYEFLNQEIFDAMAVADLVISRAGFSTLTELAALGKPALLIPIPGHQEINAQYFFKYNAVKILPQEKLTKEIFVQVIDASMQNLPERQNLARNISQLLYKDAGKRYVELVYKIIGK
ncbi:MAG: undecaprenyldiphospho-muramoylpentapeptide beta-N-acetylglucosaminyltransferase, partial [Candidatus Parcubacteria bacterium]|nr:undecaprenyldiphospho-muramoylpentapeptide beta-N-acetylglucosaminyltransferase [Candidatus Parcubacteria bacterium]